MSLKIKEITDKSTWEEFLGRCDDKTFLQSYNWGVFNDKMGKKTFRLGVYDTSTETKSLIGTALVVKVEARRGNFLFVPHGPNVPEAHTESRKKVLSCLTEKLKDLSRQEKTVFIRLAPTWDRKEKNVEVFKELDFRRAPIHVNPELTWELDISPSEREVLMDMRKNTRYLIRKGKRNEDLKIEKKQDIAGVEEFSRLYEVTSDRHDFVPFSLEYLKKQFQSFISDKQIIVLLGKYKGETVAGGIYVFWQNTGFYHHGASSRKYPKVPVSYLLTWTAIQEAKKRGCKNFNFWGVSPPDASKKHPWYGLSLFKRGFGGDYKFYVPTQDLSMSPKYWFNFIVESVRRIKRGL